jgi:hypothetical protein
MSNFLLSFNVSQIDPTIIVSRIKTAPEINDWLLLTSGILLVKADLPVTELSARIRNSFPELQFVAVEMNENSCDGWMPTAVWDFVSNRRVEQIAS